MLEKAIQIASEALASLTDDKGFPYIDHAMRVMDRMETEEEKIVAVLHDVVEDSEVSLRDLQEEGFSAHVLEAVGMLTKRKDMTYFDYIDDISCNELASKVKAAEIEDNQDIIRVQKMSFQTYSIKDRATRALDILCGRNQSINYK